jgi:hypothetical protein
MKAECFFVLPFTALGIHQEIENVRDGDLRQTIVPPETDPKRSAAVRMEGHIMTLRWSLALHLFARCTTVKRDGHRGVVC